jgi:hypothetical protein
MQHAEHDTEASNWNSDHKHKRYHEADASKHDESYRSGLAMFTHSIFRSTRSFISMTMARTN